MTPGRALDDVGAPGGVVEAGAPVRALHAAVTGEEVTAVAQGKTVSLVLTQKLVGPDGGHVPGDEEAHVDPVEQPALDLGQVTDERVLPVVAHLIDLEQPLHLAVAQEGVATQQHLRQRGCKGERKRRVQEFNFAKERPGIQVPLISQERRQED